MDGISNPSLKTLIDNSPPSRTKNAGHTQNPSINLVISIPRSKGSKKHLIKQVVRRKTTKIKTHNSNLIHSFIYLFLYPSKRRIGNSQTWNTKKTKLFSFFFPIHYRIRQFLSYDIVEEELEEFCGCFFSFFFLSVFHKFHLFEISRRKITAREYGEGALRRDLIPVKRSAERESIMRALAFVINHPFCNLAGPDLVESRVKRDHWCEP